MIYRATFKNLTTSEIIPESIQRLAYIRLLSKHEVGVSNSKTFIIIDISEIFNGEDNEWLQDVKNQILRYIRNKKICELGC